MVQLTIRVLLILDAVQSTLFEVFRILTSLSEIVDLSGWDSRDLDEVRRYKGLRKVLFYQRFHIVPTGGAMQIGVIRVDVHT